MKLKIINPMQLEFNKCVSDIRGIILFCSFKKLIIHFVETKKGFSRGGHYHPFKSDHFLLQGKIEFKEIDVDTNIEKIRIIEAPFTISVEPNVAHLLTALEDSLFLESFKTKYSAIEYLPYRNIVKKSMKQ